MSSIKLNPFHKQQNYVPQIIVVATRNKPYEETYDIPITKRPSAPSKSTMQNPMDSPQEPIPNKENTKQVSVNNLTEPTSNKGKGLLALNPDRQKPLFTATEPFPTLYRDRMKQFFTEDLIDTATRKNFPFLKTIREKDWNTLKLFNATFYEIRRHLSVISTDCIIYDNKMVISIYLEQLFIKTFHPEHTRQA